jgi:hypothetical protein
LFRPDAIFGDGVGKFPLIVMPSLTRQVLANQKLRGLEFHDCFSSLVE